MAVRRLFTSESVTEGHPDKVSDQISDAVLDNILEKDPMGKVACETLVTTGVIFVAGEITTSPSGNVSPHRSRIFCCTAGADKSKSPMVSNSPTESPRARW